MLIKAFLDWPGVMMEPISLKWRMCTLPNGTAPGGFIFFYYLLDCAASFHILAMEIHLHKVLMRFEGRGGVFN